MTEPTWSPHRARGRGLGLADVTMERDMRAIAWGDAWPLGPVLLGVLIVVRGPARRSA